MSLQILRKEIGNTDLNLLDLVLQKKVDLFKNILDAGCGEGRNMGIFVANNIPIFGVDNDPSAIRMCRLFLKSLSPDFITDRVVHAAIEDQKVFPPDSFGFIFSISVLHHCAGHDHFRQILKYLNRYSKPEGKVFIKMSALPGMEATVEAGREGLYRTPDRSVRYLWHTEPARILSRFFEIKSKVIEMTPGEKSVVSLLLRPIKQ